MLQMITGGAGSGKSVYAENCIMQLSGKRRIYIATMYPFDEESRKKVSRHQQMRRDKNFETIERYTNLRDLQIPPDADVLLECLSNLTANEMYQDDGAKEKTIEAVIDGVRALVKQARNVIVVTNEVFSDVTNYSTETRRYQEYLGRINQAVAQAADDVIEIVYGIPVRLKG